jgi:hypothetical protein
MTPTPNKGHNLARQWRKSSRSPNEGGQCIEVALWRKSTRSDNSTGQCIEVALRRSKKRIFSGEH